MIAMTGVVSGGANAMIMKAKHALHRMLWTMEMLERLDKSRRSALTVLEKATLQIEANLSKVNLALESSRPHTYSEDYRIVDSGTKIWKQLKKTFGWSTKRLVLD